jgi:uncharacterized membrane protein
MRLGLIVVFALSLITSVVGYVLLPDEIASHFGPGGQPDGWSPKWFFTVMMVIIDVVMFALFYWSPRLLDKVDRRFLSLPNRDYWLVDARLPAAAAKLAQYLAEFGMATFYLLIYAKIATIQANLAENPGLRETVFVWVIFVYMLYTVVWCVRLVMAYRIPPGESA